jgi:geranylgeranyl transferase type-2 subunit beta
MLYLDLLDETLAAGVARLPEAFRQRQVSFVLAAQCADGGFPNRAGRPDLYYTRFALEALRVLDAPRCADARQRALEYLASTASEFKTVPDCLSFLHATHLLEASGIEVFCCDQFRRGVADRVSAFLKECRTSNGGAAASPGGEPGPYHAFLSVLCHELLDRDVPGSAALVASVVPCAGADGGFAEAPGRTAGQTNPTAAALAVLTLLGDPPERTLDGVALFLCDRQSDDGGFRAHGEAVPVDLLSTFTALVTLGSLDRLGDVRLGSAGRFVRSLAAAGGGFFATPGDTEVDVEYTFYGLSALAVLATAAGG